MAHVEDPGSEPGREATPKPETAAPTAGPEIAGLAGGHTARVAPATARALQRSIGNRATAAVLRGAARLARKEATPDRVEEARKALASGNESKAHAGLRQLETAEQANKVLENYQKLGTSTFGNDTMATAAEILVSKGGSINKALNWMTDEGTNFAAMSRVVGAASGTERAKIKGKEWRDYWVSWANNKEMAQLVKTLPLALPEKLDWMREEGSDWKLMKEVIESVPREQRSGVVERADLRGFFVSECNDQEMWDALALLGGRLRKQLDWLVAEDVPDNWIKIKIEKVTDAKERLDVHNEKSVVDRIRDMDFELRVQISELIGGTDGQQFHLAKPVNNTKWVDAYLKHSKRPLHLLWIASGDARMGEAVRPRLWNLLKDHKDILYPAFQVKAFWYAFGDGSAFNAKQIMHFVFLLTGKQPEPGGKKIKGDLYFTRDPNDATARAFMKLLRPKELGGSDIAREELALGILAFCSHKWDAKNSKWEDIGTSYFHDPYIIIRVDSSGARDTTELGDRAGTPTAVGTGMDFFENHARHEIGHAVGAKKIGKMTESGNEFAIKYAGWKKSSKKDFEAALWSDVAAPKAGWPSVSIAGTPVTLTNTAVHDWCVGIIADGKEPTNDIGNAPGDLQVKLKAIEGSLWGAVKLVKYLRAIGATSPEKLRDRAFSFGGFTPTDPVQIFSTRWGNDFVSYKKGAHDAFMGISWYALSSPPEMFAEMYTARYAAKTLPAEVDGNDPAKFFTELEGQRDPMFGKKP